MNIQIYVNVVVLLFLYCELAISLSLKRYEEGDHCDIKRSNKTCQNVKKCPTIADLIRKGIEPDICGLEQFQLVCCNKLFGKTYYNKKYDLMKEEESIRRKKIIKRAAVGEKSKKMCQKYAESVYSYEDPPILIPDAQKMKVDNCGVKEEPLVVGGELARSKEFPHMVLVGHGDGNSDKVYWQCGGSLISERWVLSAAHCTATNRGLARWATVGDLKVLSNDDEDLSKPVTLKIIERKNHPEYDSSYGYNDIALYKLENNVVFNAYVRPICLNTQETPYTGKAIATGWGNTRWKGASSNDLLKVVLNLYDMKQCNDLFKTSTNPRLLAKIPKGITSHNMVCAWEKGKDTCQGDSGGPLKIKLNSPYCMYSIIGVTSFGDECAKDLPGIYTKVSYYVPWIESIVWP